MTDTETQRRPRRQDVIAKRRSSRKHRRRRSLFLGATGLAGIVAIAAVVVVGARTFGLDGQPDQETTSEVPLPGLAGEDGQSTLLLATFDETDVEQVASQVILLGENQDGATIVLIPSTTLAEVPGHGPLQLGLAHALGQTPLLELSVDNLLGIDTDASIGISRQAWAQLFARFGGLELDVPTSLVEVDDNGQRRIRFEPGVQFLDGERVAEYLTFAQEGESELNRLPRLQRVLESLLDEVAVDPARLDAVFADGAPFLDTTEPERFRDLLLLLAVARTDDLLDTRTLPVAAIGAGEQSSYRLEADRAQELIDDRFAASRPNPDRAEGRRLQILNGNGEPGIGQEVAELLQPGGYQVILTRNADSFTYFETLIVVYDDSEEQLALARDVQERLGVGLIEVSLAPQRVADITVVVGADFIQ